MDISDHFLDSSHVWEFFPLRNLGVTDLGGWSTGCIPTAINATSSHCPSVKREHLVKQSVRHGLDQSPITGDVSIPGISTPVWSLLHIWVSVEIYSIEIKLLIPTIGTIGFLSLDHCSKTNMRQMLEILKRVKVVGEVRLTSEVAIQVIEIPPSARPLLCDHCLSYCVCACVCSADQEGPLPEMSPIPLSPGMQPDPTELLQHFALVSGQSQGWFLGLAKLTKV